MNVVQTINLQDGSRIEIIQDEDPTNPREWDNLGVMACFHKRYSLGDKDHGYRSEDFSGWSAMETQIIKDHSPAVILPLYLFDHSGLTIRCDTDMFRMCDSAGWDWGQIGFIFVGKDKIRSEWKVQRISPNLKETVARGLRTEVETYDQYLQGDVYGFVLKGPDGEEKDSCWGFFGSDIAENGMLDHFPKSVREEVAGAACS